MATLNKFPTLYKQTTNGKIQQWQIAVGSNTVTTVYGLTDGKLQTTFDIVKEGKNIGRSNATTPETQAQAEAQQSFDAKLKEGYVEDITLAASTKNTLDAVEPMLAHPIDKKEKYVTFPAWSQPKFDGLRCLAVMKNGKVKLWSRTQKEYVTLPHIVEELEKMFAPYKDIVLDGELYNHKFKKDFNKITSLIKRDDVHPDHKLVEYHVYDVVGSGNWAVRTSLLHILNVAKYCLPVETRLITSRIALDEYQADCVSRGYEGCMYRSIEGLYENKRSSGLLKVKTFEDDEFKIVGVEEGSGKLMGCVGAFYCELNDGTQRQFKASPAVTLEEKAEMWKHRKDYIGKMATVQYQNYTPDGSLRFPIWKSLREGKE
jgi:ATP-dependent DNA ligase